jgi:signal transduction histidine kinase
MFSSFYRGSNVLNIEGTGLRLYIVKRYIDMLHGSVRMESALDRGTKITVELPEGG